MTASIHKQVTTKTQAYITDLIQSQSYEDLQSDCIEKHPIAQVITEIHDELNKEQADQILSGTVKIKRAYLNSQIKADIKEKVLLKLEQAEITAKSSELHDQENSNSAITWTEGRLSTIKQSLSSISKRQHNQNNITFNINQLSLGKQRAFKARISRNVAQISTEINQQKQTAISCSYQIFIDLLETSLTSETVEENNLKRVIAAMKIHLGHGKDLVAAQQLLDKKRRTLVSLQQGLTENKSKLVNAKRKVNSLTNDQSDQVQKEKKHRRYLLGLFVVGCLVTLGIAIGGGFLFASAMPLLVALLVPAFIFLFGLTLLYSYHGYKLDVVRVKAGRVTTKENLEFGSKFLSLSEIIRRRNNKIQTLEGTTIPEQQEAIRTLEETTIPILEKSVNENQVKESLTLAQSIDLNKSPVGKPSNNGLFSVPHVTSNSSAVDPSNDISAKLD